jgi:soluble lytic murein transglycosylase-like protein
MNLLIFLCLFWLGIGQPADLAEQIEAIAIDTIADPVERWRPLVSEHFPQEEVDTAMCIIRHESGGDPAAENPRSTATGLFQILESLWGPHYGVSPTELHEPETNVTLARDIWENQGWVAWSPYNRGACV